MMKYQGEHISSSAVSSETASWRVNECAPERTRVPLGDDLQSQT